MLRNILIVIGLLVALNPYLGFPTSLDRWILTGLGLSMVFLLSFSKRGRTHKEVRETVDEGPRVLHVERTEVEDSPRMHIERQTVEDTESLPGAPGEETVVEKKTTVVRRRKRKASDDFADSAQ
jgi:hypothetical protein